MVQGLELTPPMTTGLTEQLAHTAGVNAAGKVRVLGVLAELAVVTSKMAASTNVSHAVDAGVPVSPM